MLNIERLENYFSNYLISHPCDLLAYLSGFIPIIACAIHFKATLNTSKILIYYALLILILETMGGIYAANSMNNHLIYLIFYFLETLFLYIFFKNSIKSQSIQKIILSIISIMLIGILYNILKSDTQLNDTSLTLQSLGIIIITIINFYYLLFESKIKTLSKSTFFWINTGSIIYFSGCFFVFLFLTKILDGTDTRISYIYDIVSVLLFVFRIFLAIGISQTKYILAKNL
ncbi:MAG: hypothetical protein V4683_00685 [Bacteroidota bacterium]